MSAIKRAQEMMEGVALADHAVQDHRVTRRLYVM
jgi:hypothetical protein